MKNVHAVTDEFYWRIMCTQEHVADLCEAPIIGILSQETYIVQSAFPGEHHDSHIVASYVKYLESSGARVIPIWIGQTEDYYRRVVEYTNGLLFPGGGTYFNESGGYGEAATHLYNLAIEANNKGVYYPIWGICVGMQVIPFAVLGKDIRTDCLLRNKAVPLKFSEGFRNSRLFSSASKDIITDLSSENVTYNYHKYCLTKQVFEEQGILPDWKILSTNIDDRNTTFISTMESVKYPIYAVQFHPEKNRFEFKKDVGIPHSKGAVQTSQYFSNFFVDECRKNNNTFPNINIESNSLIYNYNPRYTGLINSTYEQIYVFEKEDFEKAQLV